MRIGATGGQCWPLAALKTSLSPFAAYVQNVAVTTKPASLPLLYVSELLGIGRRAVYDIARTGELAPGIPVLRVGRQHRVPTSKVEAALGIEISRADLDDWTAAQRHVELVNG